MTAAQTAPPVASQVLSPQSAAAVLRIGETEQERASNGAGIAATGASSGTAGQESDMTAAERIAKSLEMKIQAKLEKKKAWKERTRL